VALEELQRVEGLVAVVVGRDEARDGVDLVAEVVDAASEERASAPDANDTSACSSTTVALASSTASRGLGASRRESVAVFRRP
jgi:hypothetical protein